MITLRDPMSIIATLCHLAPGERAVIYPLPGIAYVVTLPMKAGLAKEYAQGSIDLYEAADPPIDADRLPAVDVYVQSTNPLENWSKVKGRGAYV